MSPPWVTWSGQALVAPLGAEAPEAQPVAPPAVPADALAPTADGFAAPDFWSCAFPLPTKTICSSRVNKIIQNQSLGCICPLSQNSSKRSLSKRCCSIRCCSLAASKQSMVENRLAKPYLSGIFGNSRPPLSGGGSHNLSSSH